MVKKGPVFSMFHQKSRGVSLILFSDGVPEIESVEKPNYARHGHGASILDYTISSKSFLILVKNLVFLVPKVSYSVSYHFW